MSSDDATEMWRERGKLAKDVTAVVPRTNSLRYERWVRQMLQGWTMRRARRHLGSRCRRIVDLGCGYGDWTVLFAELADEIVACDISPEFVAESRRRLAGSASRIEVSDVRTFREYSDADLIYLGGVLEYMTDRDVLSLLRAVRERISPTGVLMFRDWCAVNAGIPSLHTQPWFSVHRRPEAYESLAAIAGFRMIERASSLAIYREEVSQRFLDGRNAPRLWVRWPMRLAWWIANRLAQRCSMSFVMVPSGQ